MPTASEPNHRAPRFTPNVPTFLLGVATILVLSFGTAQNRAAAQEVIPEATPEGAGGVQVGDGEVSVDGGEVYAGDGCVRAGDVIVGDCEGEGGGKGDAGDDSRGGGASGADSPEETTQTESTAPEEITPSEDTTIAEETTGLEITRPEEEGGACPVEPPGDAVEASVERAVDSDTLELAEEFQGTDEVRLIGVDTPELEGENGEPEPFAEEAAAFTADALEGQTVLLQVGEEETDDHGRLLAYVWTTPEEGAVGGLKRMIGMGDSELFNRTLLEEGYAEVLTIEQGDLYAGCFEAAERSAREEEAGIWGTGVDSTDGQYGGQTTPETTAERTASEGTTSEGTVLQETTAEGNPSEDTTGQVGPGSAPPEAYMPERDAGESAGDDPAARDQYGAEQDPTGEAYSVPEYENCESPGILDSFSGDGERTEGIEVPGGSFLIAYRTQETAADEPGAFLLDVYGPGDAGDEPVEQISYEEVGTERAYVEEGPGEFTFSASAENRAYDVAVYGCGEEIAHDEPAEGEVPDGEPVEQEPARTHYAEPSPPEDRTALPITPEAAESPAQAPLQQTAHEPAAAQTSGVPYASLPTRQTSTGSVPVLPETGGPSPPAIVVTFGAAGSLTGTAMGLVVRWHLNRESPDGR